MEQHSVCGRVFRLTCRTDACFLPGHVGRAVDGGNPAVPPADYDNDVSKMFHRCSDSARKESLR